VAFHKGYVFVADGLAGVGCFRFERSGKLFYEQQLDTNTGYADKVTVYDRKLYIANDFMGLLVYDIQFPNRPTLVQ
jgi:hypothetical protein